MAILNGICRLCSEKYENSKIIDESTNNLFAIILPKIDFAEIQGSVMCKSCTEMLIKCFDFKVKCLHTQNYIVLFINENNAQLDLKDVYLSKNEIAMDVPEDEDVCGLCMDLVKNRSGVSLDVEERGVILRKMMEQCLPELDVSIIAKPIICASCRKSLENCFRFVTSCLNVEEKITKYCETLNTNSKDQKELNSSQIIIRDVLTGKIDGQSVGIIKAEDQFCENEKSPKREIGAGDLIKLEQIFLDGDEGADQDVKNTNGSFMKFDNEKVNDEQQFIPNNTWAYEEESNKLGSIKIEEILCGENKTEPEHLVEMEDENFLVNEDIEIKTDEHDFNRFENNIVLPQSEVRSMLRNREKSVMSNLERDPSKPYIEPTLTNTNNVHLMFKCDSCSFETKYNRHIKTHLLTHEDPSEVIMHKCDSCSFQTQHKDSIRKHVLIHKDPSEATMYKCDCCPFQTKYSGSLKIHSLTHKDPSEVIMYKCDSCCFQTKHKSHIKVHLLIHKDPSEVTMYECDSCLYQTKHKHYLKYHLLKHKDPSEVMMHKCDSCLFQTKHKSRIKEHLRIHKDPSEVTMYKCDRCSFHTKYSNSLKGHLLTHKDSSGVIHKCDSCSFQSEHKDSIKKHLLIHKDPSELTMYKCDSCSYSTKYKHYLKYHFLKHKDPSEVIMYKCTSCAFQTKRKNTLKRHLLNHKDPSEVTIYKCDSCSYQTKFKYYLYNHLLSHNEVKMYKCDLCSFRTKTKRGLKRHLSKHKDPSEVTA